MKITFCSKFVQIHGTSVVLKHNFWDEVVPHLPALWQAIATSQPKVFEDTETWSFRANRQHKIECRLLELADSAQLLGQQALDDLLNYYDGLSPAQRIALTIENANDDFATIAQLRHPDRHWDDARETDGTFAAQRLMLIAGEGRCPEYFNNIAYAFGPLGNSICVHTDQIGRRTRLLKVCSDVPLVTDKPTKDEKAHIEFLRNRIALDCAAAADKASARYLELLDLTGHARMRGLKTIADLLAGRSIKTGS